MQLFKNHLKENVFQRKKIQSIRIHGIDEIQFQISWGLFRGPYRDASFVAHHRKPRSNTTEGGYMSLPHRGITQSLWVSILSFRYVSVKRNPS